MGLGKTHQAMALMVSIMAREKKNRFLVVCPTSVLYHWKDKLTQFAPSFSISVYHGPLRNHADIGTSDVTLTTYGILRRDCKYISEVFFELVVFDEIQLVKNIKSQLYFELRENGKIIDPKSKVEIL